MIAEAVANKMVKVRKDFGQVAITDEDIRIVNNIILKSLIYFKVLIREK